MSRVSRRAFLRASGAAATVGALAGCVGGTGGGGGPVVIGGLEPLSGLFAPWSNPHQEGLQFAIDEVNEDGGVLGGRDLELTVTDTGADAAQADSSFRRMVEQDGAVATTGAVSSDVGIVLSQTAEDLQVPHLLHMAGASEIITENSQHIFRIGLVPSVRSIQAQASAFADAGYESVSAIVADYAWGRAAESAMNEYFDIDVDIHVAPPGASDFRSYIRQFPDDVELVSATGHPPGTVSIANQVMELGLEPDVIAGSSAPPQLLVGALSDAAIEPYVHIHNTDAYTDEFADVAGRFGEANDTQFNTHTAYGYVTGRMLAAAIDDAGGDDPSAIADAIRDIQFDSLFAEPIQYSQYGELDQTVVIYSRLLKETPSYDDSGSYSYEELSRSDPVPALPPEQ